jgi:hypothetical protein
MALFEKSGLHPIAAPTEHRMKRKQGISPRYFFPDSRAIHNAELAFHEFLGTIWAKLRGQI